MLANCAVVRAVAGVLAERYAQNLVVGHALLEKEARSALEHELLPLALVVTPNLYEAEVLTGGSVRNLTEMKDAARAIGAMGPRYVVVKGGHLGGPAAPIQPQSRPSSPGDLRPSTPFKGPRDM